MTAAIIALSARPRLSLRFTPRIERDATLVCSACDRRADDPVTSSCTFAGCGLIHRRSA